MRQNDDRKPGPGTEPPSSDTDTSPPQDAYRELFERSADAILIIEGDTFIDCNAAAVRMLRHERKRDVLRTHPSELSPPRQPDGRSSFEKANEIMALAFKQGSQRFEWEHVRADGEALPVEVLLTAVQDRGRQVLHVVWRDISERKALEEQLRHAQKMEAIGRLAGGIAHDFNNLLVIIQGYADLVSNHQDVTPPVQQHVAHILEASDRATALVRQLMAFGRKQQVRPRVLDVNALVSASMALLKPLVGDEVQLNSDIAEQSIHIKADAGQIEQILMNLVSNASDAMPEGGSLCIETRSVQLSEDHIGAAKSLPPGRYALLAITDTGMGMQPEIVARAFDPFFTTKQIGEGSGLGLATVYGIVAQASGAVELLSTPGHGTTVKIYLPTTQERASQRGLQRGQAEPTHEVPGGDETILVVEDEPAVSQLVLQSLQELGYRTHLAADGKRALELYRTHQASIDLILSDVMLPHLSGPEFVAQLRRDGHEPAVLFMSGYTNNALIHVSRLPGEVDLLEKPFRSGDLARRVRRALDRARSQPPGCGA
ncbi:MAG: hypothetical protein DRQ55_04845 [Planctomycetota bacterium]|nr:MAG: hypothetical protein DRQ55_04845 [Planctomycetota bacterium]